MGQAFPHLCAPTEFLDHEAPAVRAFLERATPNPHRPPHELARDLYYAVRDDVRYEIYGADISRDGLRASAVARRRSGLCIHKAVLYAACARALQIASRLYLVDVRNHVASRRLRMLVGGDVFHYHCLAEVNLDGRWVKVTPVFSASLCRLYRITPLEFDGRTDAVLQPYDECGRAFIQIVREHGAFEDLPYDMILAGLRRSHAALFAGSTRLVPGSLVAETREA